MAYNELKKVSKILDIGEIIEQPSHTLVNEIRSSILKFDQLNLKCQQNKQYTKYKQNEQKNKVNPSKPPKQKKVIEVFRDLEEYQLYQDFENERQDLVQPFVKELPRDEQDRIQKEELEIESQKQKFPYLNLGQPNNKKQSKLDYIKKCKHASSKGLKSMDPEFQQSLDFYNVKTDEVIEQQPSMSGHFSPGSVSCDSDSNDDNIILLTKPLRKMTMQPGASRDDLDNIFQYDQEFTQKEEEKKPTQDSLQLLSSAALTQMPTCDEFLPIPSDLDYV